MNNKQEQEHDNVSCYELISVKNQTENIKGDELVDFLISFLLEDLLVDSRFNVMIFPNRIKGLTTNMTYIRSYVDTLMFQLKAN